MSFIDEKAFLKALHANGYLSKKHFIQKTGFSINTLASYFRGKSVYHEKFVELANLLHMNPNELVSEYNSSFPYQYTNIEPVVIKLKPFLKDNVLVLFGSRARNTHHQYSDWDLGIYSHKGIIKGDLFLTMLSAISDSIESAPQKIDFVNLTLADDDFLKNTAKGVRFVEGRRLAFRKLLCEIELCQK